MFHSEYLIYNHQKNLMGLALTGARLDWSKLVCGEQGWCPVLRLVGRREAEAGKAQDEVSAKPIGRMRSVRPMIRTTGPQTCERYCACRGSHLFVLVGKCSVNCRVQNRTLLSCRFNCFEGSSTFLTHTSAAPPIACSAWLADHSFSGFGSSRGMLNLIRECVLALDWDRP